MRSRFTRLIIFIIPAIVFICGFWLWYFSPNQPQPKKEILFKGITYERVVTRNPRPLIFHLIRVDLKEKGIRFLVTPGNPKDELPLKAQTTSQFLNRYNLQIAINGDFFDPWYNKTILDYYPHTGDPVDPLGFAASEGIPYSELRTSASGTLYLSKTNKVSFDNSNGKIFNALSGHPILVKKGIIMGEIDDKATDPRTAIGIDKTGRHLIILVVDGRQPGYSEGVSLKELAEIMVQNGAYQAMNLDGGGSSSLVKEGLFGKSVVINRPIDQNIPGRERAVGNHLGIYAKP